MTVMVIISTAGALEGMLDSSVRVLPTIVSQEKLGLIVIVRSPHAVNPSIFPYPWLTTSGASTIYC